MGSGWSQQRLNLMFRRLWKLRKRKPFTIPHRRIIATSGWMKAGSQVMILHKQHRRRPGGKSEGGSEGGKGESKGRDNVGVFITKFGQRYHLFESCQSLQTSILRSSPPCHRCAYCSEQSRLRRGEPIWCRGWGEIYHRNAPSPLPCSTGSEKKYDQCTLCSQELRRRGLNL